MSRTKRGSKGPGYDYWGKRPLSGAGYGSDIKRMTNRIERRAARQRLGTPEADGGLSREPEFFFTCSRCGELCEYHERSGETTECVWC